MRGNPEQMHPKLRGAVFVFVTVCLWKLLSPSQLFKFLEILPYLKSWYFFIIISELDMNLVVFIMCCGVYNMLNNAFKLWLCNILDVAGLPDYLDVPNFYIISKHTKINHNSRFGRFWEDLDEKKKMYVLACQSVTSRDALLKSAATRRLLIASTEFQFGIHAAVWHYLKS